MNKFFKRLALLLAVLMIVSMMPVQLFADNGVITYVNNGTENGEDGTTTTEVASYVTAELEFGSNVSAEDIVAAKALYEGKKFDTCKAANEAYMALFGVTWEKGYLDVTDNSAPLYKYAGVSGSVAEVKYYIHGTLAGFTSLQSNANNIDCTVGGNHQIARTSISIIGVDDENGGKAKLTDGNIQAYVAGGYISSFTASGKLTIDNIEFTSTTSTTVGASAAKDANSTQEVTSAEMEIKNCKFNGRLYVYDNFDNAGVMTYNIHDNVFDGANYNGDSNAYAIFAQCKGGNKLIIADNKISGFARGINIDHANVNATISGNTISIKDAGRSCIQLSSLTSTVISNNTLELTGGNAITLHEKLLTLTAAPEITVEGNTITGNGYLIYDDAAANSKAFTSENLTLTIGTNTVASTVDTTQGVKESKKCGLSETVTTAINEALTPAYVAKVNGVGYTTLEEAIANATPDANGVITYEIYGKATVDSTGWVQVARAGLTGLTKVEFVGKTSDAEICITGGAAILADQIYDIDVSFESLTLSKLNPTWAGDFGHSTNYFTTWLCNTNATENTVTYTNCTFPNGVCNNQYGKTVFDGCKFNNAASDKYNLWNYGGETVVKDSAFTGARGIKTYDEDTTFASSQTIEIVKTTFDGITEKAAIVSSKPTSITLTGVSVTDCAKGLLQKDLGTGVTIKVNGSNISGTFDVTADKTAAEGFNITAGTFTSEVDSAYLAEGFTITESTDAEGNKTYGVEEKVTYVARVQKRYGSSTWQYCSTFEEALELYPSGDCTIELLADVEYNGYINQHYRLKVTGATDSDGKPKYELKGLRGILLTGVTFENVYLNLTGTLEIDGYETTLKNCIIRAKDVGYGDIADGLTTAFTGGKAYDPENNKYSYLVRVTGKKVSMTDCLIDGTDKDNSYFPNMCLCPVSGTDVTMTNCTFNEGYAACYYSTPNGTWTLDNCKFTKIYCYNIQAGDTAANIVVKNCELAGWTSFDSAMTSVSFENCSFAKSSGYATVVAHKDATFTNCTFTEDYKDNIFVEVDTSVDLKGCKVVDANGDVSGTVTIAQLVAIDDATAIAAIDATKDENGKYTGGKFVGAESAIEGRLAEGYIPTKNADGTYGVKQGSYVAQIGDVKYETLTEAIAAAKDGETIVLSDGVTVTLDNGVANAGAKARTVTIKGNGTQTVDVITKAVNAEGGMLNYQRGSSFTFENVKIKAGEGNFDGIVCSALTFKGCTIEGKLTLYGAATFTGCTFENTMANQYSIWTWGGTDVTIENCVFNTNGKAILLYGQATKEKPTNLVVKKTEFNDRKNGAAGKAAIEIGNDYKATYTLNAEDCTVNGFAEGLNTGSTLWGNKNSMDVEHLEVVKDQKLIYGGVAKIGEDYYRTLAEAIAAAKDGETVKLLADCSGDGIQVAVGKFPTNGLTIDFDGHIYTVGGVLVGSSSTASNGFQLLKDNKITMLNGAIYGDTSVAGDAKTDWTGAPAILIQNYCDLTLKGMTVVGGKETCYTMSNNNGNVVIEDSTIKAGNGTKYGPFAFDVCRYSSYPSVSVTVKGNSVIEGDIEISGAIGEGQSRQLNIEGGTFTGTFSVANTPANIAISGGTFSNEVPADYCAEGYIPTKNADGTYGVKEGKYVAQIDNVKYETLEEAYAAAKNGDTITLLEDCKSDRINLEDKSVTVVLNGKTLTSTAAHGVMFCAKNGNKITIDGTVEGSKLVGTLMITSGTDGHIEVNGGTYESSQYCPIYVNGEVNSENSTVTVKNAIIKATNSDPEQDGSCAAYLAGYSTSVFENCTITAPVTGIEIRAGKLTLTNCDVTGGDGEVKEAANGNGTTVTNAALAISQHNTKKPIEVIIDGGTFTGTAAVYQTDVQRTGSDDVKIAVKSGTFNGTISGETDGTIAISGGKFTSKVDDKYFEDGYTCSDKAGDDGYYTVVGNPITSTGLTLGEDISIRIGVDAKYKDGKIKVTYETYDPNTKGMVTKELILDKYELAWDDDKDYVKYQFRIRNITPQMADVVFTLQYLDSEDNEIGSAKQISIVEYCRKFAETSAFEAYKAKIGQLLNYCATAMDLRAKTHGNDVYNGLSWKQRATALRAKISEFGYTFADFDFGKVGQYSNIIREKIVTSFGIEFAESVKLYYFIPLDNYKDGYTYVADGLLTPVPVYDEYGVLTGYRVYLTVAMDGYHTMRTLYVYDANGKEVQKIGMAPDFALKYLYNSDKQTNEFKQLCKAAYQYFITFAE